jgi:hypothetical protein
MIRCAPQTNKIVKNLLTSMAWVAIKDHTDDYLGRDEKIRFEEGEDSSFKTIITMKRGFCGWPGLPIDAGKWCGKGYSHRSSDQEEIMHV